MILVYETKDKSSCPAIPENEVLVCLAEEIPRSSLPGREDEDTALRPGGQQDRPGAREDGQVGPAPQVCAGQRPPDVRGLRQVRRGGQPLLPEDAGRAAGHKAVQVGPGAAAAGRQGGDRHVQVEMGICRQNYRQKSAKLIN